ARAGDPHRRTQRMAVLANVLPVVATSFEEAVGNQVVGGPPVDLRPVLGLRGPVREIGNASGELTSCSLAAPFGHRRPREIGESGSPSIWTTLSSVTKTFCPQPTAQ